MDEKYAEIEDALNAFDHGSFTKGAMRAGYWIIGSLSWLIPVWVLIQMVGTWGNGMSQLPAGEKVWFIIVECFVLCVSIAIGWWSFVFWFKREKSLRKIMKRHRHFVSIPLWSHFLKNFGTWAGIVAIVMGIAFLIAALCTVGSNLGTTFILTAGFCGSGWLIIFGFVTILVLRLLGDILGAFGSMADNLRVLADEKLGEAHGDITANADVESDD